VIFLSYSSCLLGNQFTAVCKEKPSWKEKTNKPKYVIIRLKVKAHCSIKKAINQSVESHIIQKYKRAFSQVLVDCGNALETSLGELRCDFCSCSPEIKNRHHVKHQQPSFLIDRINEHPLVCFENNIIEHEPYAEIQ